MKNITNWLPSSHTDKQSWNNIPTDTKTKHCHKRRLTTFHNINMHNIPIWSYYYLSKLCKYTVAFYCIYTIDIWSVTGAWSHNVPFNYDRSTVQLHAADFANLNTHCTGRVPTPEAHIEIHRDILNTGTPGWCLPVEYHARMIIADSPLLKGCRGRTFLPLWPPTNMKKWVKHIVPVLVKQINIIIHNTSGQPKLWKQSDPKQKFVVS